MVFLTEAVPRPSLFSSSCCLWLHPVQGASLAFNFTFANQSELENALILLIYLSLMVNPSIQPATPITMLAMVQAAFPSPRKTKELQGHGCNGLVSPVTGGAVGRPFTHRYTLIPTSILLGLGAAPLWSAQSTYLTIMGNTHAKKAGKHGKDVVNQYFGIFFLVFQSSGVWGNLISSLVFGQTPSQGKILIQILFF